MAREYFNAYFSYLDSMEELSDAECGRLFKACLIYSMSGTTPELRGNERYVFPTMRGQIDRDIASYEERCRMNKENGAKANERTVPNGTKRSRTVPNAPQDKGKGKDKGDNIPPISPKGDDDAFERFWKVYPRKVGKTAARKAFSKIKGVSVDDMIAAVNEQKKTEQWTRDNGQYIPHPTTWLNEGRWDDVVNEKVTSTKSALFMRGLKVAANEN